MGMYGLGSLVRRQLSDRWEPSRCYVQRFPSWLRNAEMANIRRLLSDVLDMLFRYVQKAQVELMGDVAAQGLGEL